MTDYDRTATLEDLEWTDGFALGGPTRFGGSAGQRTEFRLTRISRRVAAGLAG